VIKFDQPFKILKLFIKAITHAFYIIVPHLLLYAKKI